MSSATMAAGPSQAVPPLAGKSSLELMLDMLMRKEEQQVEHVPPPLPRRPMPRGRPQTNPRSLPPAFRLNTAGLALLFGDNAEADGKEGVFKSGIFGSNKKMKVRKEDSVESPYGKAATAVKMEAESVQKRMDAPMLTAMAAVKAAVPPASPTPLVAPRREKSGFGDPIDYVLKKKLRVWCSVSYAKWELGQIKSVLGDYAEVSLANGKVLTVPVAELLPANPNVLDGADDLIQLSYLNEPSVLSCLHHRYTRDLVYTKAGPVLVVVNPFKNVPLYGKHHITGYKKRYLDSPHVYAMADAAYTGMMTDGVNQSIIISGESGSGKTETAKVAMQYLAALGGGTGLESKIMKTNVILESFGNAKTLSNNNASRFGKLIEIRFSETGKICGAEIQTFLLEKSRVIQRTLGERSFHVFYQLCSGASGFLREQLILREVKAYEYLSRSSCLEIDGVDDAEGFKQLTEALDVVQITKDEQMKAFSMISAVLWLGNITFNVIDSENHVEVVSNEGVAATAKLLGCNIPDLMLALSTRKIQAGKDTVVQKLTISQAVDARDALAKSIYANLFDWLVDCINRSLGEQKGSAPRSISILDIYGFECFRTNGFEQFCINYANERLQQHFNRHLFKLEQEEYIEDGIDWTGVEFTDNTDCLNLFEKKPLGFISLLNEECTFPKASDLTFANKLKQHLSGKPCFKAGQGPSFRVIHYAGEVIYDTTGFLEKNRDALHLEAIQLLSSCSCELTKHFASIMANESHKNSNSFQKSFLNLRKQSIVSKFKAQLFNLMQKLENTKPHFIRCIKPNGKQCPGMYENDLVLQQLRCFGVLEVVRISRSGYPTRMTHQQFADRYGCLLMDCEPSGSQDPLSVAVSVLQQFNLPPEMYQVGYTKLFFRTGQIAEIEDARCQMLQGAIWIQKYYRCLRARRHYQGTKTGATIIQSFVRGEHERLRYSHLVRKWKAAILIQKNVRCRIARIRVGVWHRDITLLQSVIRGCLSRSKLNALKKQHMLLTATGNDELLIDSKDDYQKETDMTSHLVHPLVIEELRKQLALAQAALREKETENLVLRQQIDGYKKSRAEYDAKLKLVDDTWQQRLTSLQTSLSVAKRTLAAEHCNDNQSRQHDVSPIHTPYVESQDASSAGTRTPEVLEPRYLHNHIPDPRLASNASSMRNHNAVDNLAKEFEDRRQVFEEDAGFLLAVKSGQVGTVNMNADEELRQLKERFTAWKRDFKNRLREAKNAFHRMGNAGDDKSVKRRWWGKKNAK